MTSLIHSHHTQTIHRGTHRIWYLKLNDPISQKALSLRFSILSSRNGFKKHAEICAIFFERDQYREVKKIALKNTRAIELFTTRSSMICIEECELSTAHTRGTIQSKGNTIKWDLAFQSLPQLKNSSPSIDEPNRFSTSSAILESKELLFSGTTEVNGHTLSWENAPGLQGHAKETAQHHSWIWAHCNLFINEKTERVPFVFEGVGVRNRLGPIISPPITSLYFLYQGQPYIFKSLKDSFFIKSKNTLNEWNFRADRDDLSFRGHIRAELKDFVGITYEDVSGSLLYVSSTNLSHMNIFVYRRGKLETTLIALGTGTFEIVSREKNPYVPLVV